MSRFIPIQLSLAAVAMVSFSALASPPPRHPGPRRPPQHGRERPRPRPPAGRPIHVQPPRPADSDDLQAAEMMANAIGGLQCDRIGEALRRLSNTMLSNARFASTPDRGLPSSGNPGRDRLRRQQRDKWRGHMHSRVFWTRVWERLTDAYRQCDMPCFDDGVAIGQLSGVGYCAASVAVDGLGGPGFVYQPPLPLCETAIFAGCQAGYQEAAGSYEGCATYSGGDFESIFDEYKSQDCHVDPE